jgi:hypothetical protein
MNEAGRRKATEETHRVHEIDDMIDVEAVARSLLIADAGDRPVEAVAKPVEGEEHRHSKERPRRPPCGRERHTGAGRAHHPEDRQVVGVDRRWKPVRDPHEQPLFGGCQHAPVLAHVGGRRQVRHDSRGHEISLQS